MKTQLTIMVFILNSISCASQKREVISKSTLKLDMKYYFLILSLLVSLNIKSQQEESIDIYSQDIERNDYNYPNTNIGKASLALHVGWGYSSYSGNLENYFRSKGGGIVSLDCYFENNLTFSLTVMGTTAYVKEEISINNNLWIPNDTLDIQSYGFNFGYSILNKVHWRINPFGGLVLSNSKLISPSGTKYRIGTKLSPVIGINFSYRFINVKKRMQETGTSGCIGINARIAHVPFAMHKKNVPFSGGLWYMTIGITLNMFGTD